MNVGVHDRLPGCHSVIDSDVEAVWLPVSNESGTYLAHKAPNRRLLLIGQIEHAGDVLLGNDECVAAGDRKPIEERHGELVLHDDFCLR